MSGETIAWDESFRIGNDIIDQQHQELIELVAALSDDGQTYQDAQLAAVLDYAMYHFAEEEALQEEIGYPGFEAHRAEHGRLVEALTTIRDQYWAREIPPGDFRRFMFDWVLDHVKVHDARIGAFLASREHAA